MAIVNTSGLSPMQLGRVNAVLDKRARYDILILILYHLVEIVLEELLGHKVLQVLKDFRDQLEIKDLKDL